METQKLLIRSPFRRGPGILRMPEDPQAIAVIHYNNKLKWRLFHQWQKYLLQMKLKRLKYQLIEFIYKRKLLKRCFKKWHCYAAQAMEIKKLCITYRRTGNRCNENKMIMNLIVSIHRYRHQLLKKYFTKWHYLTTHHH